MKLDVMLIYNSSFLIFSERVSVTNMASMAKCSVHGQLFCKSCLIGNKKKEKEEMISKTKEVIEAPKKNLNVTPSKGSYKIRFKAEELDEQANFIVVFKRPSESGKQNKSSIGIISILEK